MSALDAVVDALYASKTFDFKVASWQYNLKSATREQLDDARIELRCRPNSQSIREGLIEVGEPAENLGDLDILIEIHDAQRIFRSATDQNREAERDSAIGVLSYHPPIPAESLAGLSQHIIDESRIGSVTGWMLFGSDTIRETIHLLNLRPEQEMHIWTTVSATATPTPYALIYETKDFHPTNYRWNAAQNPLKIKEAHIVVASAKPRP